MELIRNAQNLAVLFGENLRSGWEILIVAFTAFPMSDYTNGCNESL